MWKGWVGREGGRMIRKELKQDRKTDEREQRSFGIHNVTAEFSGEILADP